MRRMTRRVDFRLTRDEREKVEAAAEQVDRTVSAFARRAVIEKANTVAKSKEEEQR
jgi:uncharacterized protein (DUF1778 family)